VGQFLSGVMGQLYPGGDNKADEIPKLNMAIEQLEEELVNRAYSKYKNSYKVAEVLGISQPTAFRKIKKYINS